MRTQMVAIAAVLFALTGTATATPTAREILDRSKALEDTTRHWDDRYRKMELTIQGRRGERHRELELYERKYPEGEQRTIVFFLGPAEVRGTGLLAYTHKEKPADQWLYLPTLNRVRQINANTRNESFVGTDLTYHELDLIAAMPSWTEEDASSKLRGKESVNGVSCYVIELTPQRDDIDYKRIVVWLGENDLMARQMEFYEQASGDGWLASVLGSRDAQGGGPKKRLLQEDVRSVGEIPVAFTVDILTPAAGTKTRMNITEIKFDQGLKESLFTRRYLERGGR